MHTNTDTLRPTKLDEYKGQSRLKERLAVRVAAAMADERPIDHILLTGPPGSGKTTLATIVAEMTGDPFVSMVMPISDKTLESLVREHTGIVLFDELHNASKAMKERMLPLLEFGYLATTRGTRITNGWFTVIGATTEPENIPPALRRRFRWNPVWEDYSPADLAEVVTGMLAKAEVTLCAETVVILGEAAGGMPHVAGELVLGARDLTSVYHKEPSVAAILDYCGLTPDGLTEDHLRYLTALKEDFGGTAGLAQLANGLRLDPRVVRELERLLVTRKLITFGERGRELTSLGHRRFGTTAVRAGRTIRAVS